MNIKKKLVNVFIATTLLMTGTVTFQAINESQTTNAAVNYYYKTNVLGMYLKTCECR